MVISFEGGVVVFGRDAAFTSSRGWPSEPDPDPDYNVDRSQSGARMKPVRTSVSTTRAFLLSFFAVDVFAEGSSSELSDSSAVLSDTCDVVDFAFRLP